MGVKLFGDIAFYVAYDSVAVWAHPEIFSLDAQGAMTGIAGVPPDYFSEDGQLWGMPTFKWDVLRERDYDWWIDRLKRNLTLFDIVRIDHFRAFAEYWQVPAGATTAKTGVWLDGPGMDFFEVVRERWSDLPLVAEDLGYNMENVYALRKEANLPGMKVLQFAFGDNMPQSVDIPHNYPHDCFAYTGTHDNNTTIGWYKSDTGKADHKRMEQYFGVEVGKKNIHLVMARAVYASVARVAILPIQDVLGLDDAGRMNLPGTVYNNWVWKLPMDALTREVEDMLCEWTWVYNRR